MKQTGALNTGCGIYTYRIVAPPEPNDSYPDREDPTPDSDELPEPDPTQPPPEDDTPPDKGDPGELSCNDPDTTSPDEQRTPIALRFNYDVARNVIADNCQEFGESDGDMVYNTAKTLGTQRDDLSAQPSWFYPLIMFHNDDANGCPPQKFSGPEGRTHCEASLMRILDECEFFSFLITSLLCPAPLFLCSPLDLRNKLMVVGFDLTGDDVTDESPDFKEVGGTIQGKCLTWSIVTDELPPPFEGPDSPDDWNLPTPPPDP